MFALSTLRRPLTILKEYCLNSSLAGVRYIADERYHYSERIFWILCLAISSIGSYHLITDYYNTFESNAISMVVESIRPQDTTQFPSIGVCELGYGKQEYPRLEDLINKMIDNTDMEYNFDVEDFLLRVIFQNLYNFGSLSIYCSLYENCDDCLRCPLNGYARFANIVRSNCSELFEKCMWNGKEFNCCDYFKPVQTTMGLCFLMNSIQATHPGNKDWFNLEIGWELGNGQLDIDFYNAITVNILNEEDIPHMLLTSLQFVQQHAGFEGTLKLSLQNIVNDPEIRDINPQYRKCIFPDEMEHGYSYKYYSFSTCVTECLKQAQLKFCNCTHYNLIVNEEDSSPSCNYDGLLCLDQNDLMYPQTTIMQPWRTNGLVCRCYPSCNEHEIKIVERTFRLNPSEKNRSISISLQSLPTQRYRRQAVRGNLDLVVSIGGIVGLFMGASILSGVELVYFFTARIVGSFFLRSNERAIRKV